jgi:phage-related protein
MPTPTPTQGLMVEVEKVLDVVFARTQAGSEPVRDWLRALPSEEKRIIGFKIKEVQFGWPIGMPLTRNLGNGLWEVRINLPGTERIARVIFTLHKNNMVLLHGFIKKTQKTPEHEIETARNRLRNCKF